MNVKLVICAVFSLVLIITSCTPPTDKKIVTKEVLDELASRKIKKVTDPQLFSAGYTFAKSIRDSLVRSAANVEIQAGLIEEGVQLQVLDLDSASGPLESEAMNTIVESYRYSLKEKLPTGDNISDLNAKQLIYSDLILDEKTCEHLGSSTGKDGCVLVLILEKKIIVESLQ